MRLAYLLILAAALPANAAEYRSAVADFRVETVVENLQQPSGMVFLPDGRALLADRRAGALYRLDVGARTLTPIAGLPALLARGDAGLIDVTLHPDYARNGWIYFSYTEGNLERSTLAVDRARLDGDKLVARERILLADAWSDEATHYGGRLQFHEDHLFVTVGDRHRQERAQDLDSHAGKILRVQDDGSPPADNPFASGPGGQVLIWSYGHRNPQGLVVDSAAGHLWSHEHGPLGGDELNLVQRGANYGWPVISWGFEYDGGPIGKGIVVQEGMTRPLWVWTPSVAPSDLVIYSGRRFPGWKGSLFSGALAGSHLNRLVMRDGRMVLEERLLFPDAGRVRLVEEGPDGLLYFGSDHGRIVRLVPLQR